MARYSVDEFVKATSQDEGAASLFELESPHLLEVNLRQLAWAKLGTMIGYVGNVKFSRQSSFAGGVGRFLKKAVTGEGAKLMKLEGQGRVYLADEGKKVQILNLRQGETIFVNGNDLLALEDSVQWDITMMRKVSSMLAGGLFNVRLDGPGMVAITTHYEPLTLRVQPGQPVFTDPQATVAWSGSLSPEVHTDISFKTFLGKGSGESFQLRFAGDGWVVLQPFEETYGVETS
jgi:uncharacterized protein (AIM24 family)